MQNQKIALMALHKQFKKFRTEKSSCIATYNARLRKFNKMKAAEQRALKLKKRPGFRTMTDEEHWIWNKLNKDKDILREIHTSDDLEELMDILKDTTPRNLFPITPADNLTSNSEPFFVLDQPLST